MFVAFDLLHRWLRARGHDVVFVRNITDVDDKIIQRAQAEGISALALAERNIVEFRRDVESLGCLPASHEPRATQWVGAMVELVEKLEARGLAYAVGSDVYYAVRAFDAATLTHRWELDDVQFD